MEKPLVLLADDNEATRTLITAVLHRDFGVDLASDGNEAIEKLKRREYAAILLDLLMPIADGFSVLDYLRRENPEMLGRVLVVTAAAGRWHTDRLSDYALCGVIAKPFEVEVLLESVRNCAGISEPFSGGPLMAGGMLLMLADLLRRV